MKIPFFDFKKENECYIDDVLLSITGTVKSGQFILGTKSKKFEEAFAEYLGAKYCVGVGNGFDAIKIILMALDVNQHSEVIVPAHTFIASWLPASELGAKLVPVEADPTTFNMDVALVERSITDRTKAIIVVHLYGRPVEMEALKEISNRYGIPIVEDSAQAHGATGHLGQKCGSIGHAAAFSFYPTKNLGAFGDAGAIVTNDNSLYEKVKLIRNYGSSEKYRHDCFGLNSRLDEIQAGILYEKLKYLDQLIAQRRAIAKYYDNYIKSDLIELPEWTENHVWHQYVIKVKNRELFINYLTDLGIGTLIHYPIPPHLSGAYKEDFLTQKFPITESICNQVVSLPIYPGLNQQAVDYVVNACNQFETS